ncbi:phospholipase A2 [Streptomyces sp. TRM76323]|uniref:Phospholipase A2 n=1 Tax=Streptomyces tamarix TaxID=3078565 RepID=A0ABU3QHR1_9ACTN|nr:phospholipase A2 [Streptomyces tamarix]MDT9682290.1 phospholipase A2 [Streptomyces tamarix]
MSHNFFMRGEFVRSRRALPVFAVVSLSLLFPQEMARATPAGIPPAAGAAVVEPPLADGEVQQVGPGVYSTADRSFEIYETDVAVGLMSRSHTVAVQPDGVSKPESAPVSRTDMGVFGPGWEAEFVGGRLNRKLELRDDTAVITDLTVNAAVTYTLKSSLDFPDGGGARKYASSEGDTFTETTRFNEATGTMESTATETVNMATSVPDEDLSADTDAGVPGDLDQLTPTYTWKQVAAGADNWRVTGVGTVANAALSTVTYDTAGRVAAVKDTEIGETTSRLLAVKYSTATTATSTTPGEFAGRVREITLADGATVQTLARYSYDTSGLLRSVANPAEGIEAVSSYAYDTTGRVSDVTSPANGDWDLSFPAGSASPDVDPVGPERPTEDAPLEGAGGITDPAAGGPLPTDFTDGEITDPQAYPRHCSAATDWLWYLKSNCAAWAAHYGWHRPYFKVTPTKHRVVGINYDGCSTPGPNISRPGGFNFRVACDMHDYGYGLIGNTYKGYRYYLDRSKKTNVENAFHTTMKTYSCKAYFITRRPACNSFAYAYYKAVSNKKWGGQPKTGADAT